MRVPSNTIEGYKRMPRRKLLKVAIGDLAISRVGHMGFGVRVTNGFVRGGIKSLGELIRLTAPELRAVCRPFGRASLREVRDVLVCEFGLHLKKEGP